MREGEDLRVVRRAVGADNSSQPPSQFCNWSFLKLDTFRLILKKMEAFLNIEITNNM